MSVPKPKKMVSRNVAIALGIVCVILVASLGAVMFMSYSPTTSASITSLQSQLDQLQSTYNNYQASHHHTDSDYDSYTSTHSHTNSEYDAIQNQMIDLTNTLNLGKSTVWVNDQTVNQPSGSYTDWTPFFSASYCGYAKVQVFTSTTTNTYVRVIYASNGVNYDNQISVGSSGTAVFPILPSSSIDIRIGNSNLFNGATETVTITYYY